MIRILDSGEIPVCEIVRREAMTVNVEQIVADIVADVQANGDEALLRYTQKFDGAVLQSLEVTPQEIAEAWAQVEPEFWIFCSRPHRISRDYHSRQLRQSYLINDQPGILLGQKILHWKRQIVYSGRHGSVSFYGADELYSGENSRRGGNHHGYTSAGRRQRCAGHFGRCEGSRCRSYFQGGWSAGHCGIGLWDSQHPQSG